MRGVVNIKIFVNNMPCAESEELFENIVTKFHAEYVARYVEGLKYPTEEKLKLLDSVAHNISQELKGKHQK